MQSIFQAASHELAMHPLAGFIVGLLTYCGPPLLVIWVWRKLRVKPSERMIHGALIWLGLAVLASAMPALQQLWWWVLGIWLAVAFADLVLLLLVKPLIVERKLPGRFAIGVASDVRLTVRNRTRMPLRLTIYDGLPETGVSEALPWQGELSGDAYVMIDYPLIINERGDAFIDAAHIQYESLFRLWIRQVRSGERQETKVYPNYEPVVQFALLAMESRPEQMGIIMKNRAGLSKEFHQLRDYQLGDMLSQVDWKATSKKLQLISRDYQEQRDQNLILAIDCGQRMRAMDGKIPQFDHCLNAMLLLAYVALRQGDHVGVLSFGGEERWLPPVKGINAMTTLLNHLYDYRTSTSPSDYSEAAERFLIRQRRRSLVVFLTNIRGEDGMDLIAPLQQVRKKHVVVLASIKENEVVNRADELAATLDDALAVGASHLYFSERRQVLRELRSHGIQTVDATAQDLPVQLANRYLMARESV